VNRCTGLFFEAADWNYEKHELKESEPKVLFSPVPRMHFVPNKIEEFADYPHYECPMYKTSERRGVLSTTGHSTNFVMDVRVPTGMSAKHWIKRGTALLTTLND
jgi:dynein heavy chain, axonemal